MKQHPTPSPTHLKPSSLSHQSDKDEVNGQVDDEQNTDVEKVLTAEEIAKLYEDKDPDENIPPSLSTHQPNLQYGRKPALACQAVSCHTGGNALPEMDAIYIGMKYISNQHFVKK